MLSIVIPCYNEGNKLENAVERIENEIKRINVNYEIIIAEDGSEDGSDKIATKLALESNNIKHLHSDIRLGKGGALNRSFREASGDILMFIDVDLSTDPKSIPVLVKYLKKYDVCIGSRYLKKSKVKRSLKRLIASKVFNSWYFLILYI